MFLLPEETRWVRRVESEGLALARAQGFEEVIFPRAMPMVAWQEVVGALGPMSAELDAETVAIPSLGGEPHVLCHWQCEPYYRALAQWGDHTPSRVVDRSGASYRNEARIGPYRWREFLRLELVWRGPAGEVAALYQTLLDAYQRLLVDLGLAVQRRSRADEVQASFQREVVDLVVPAGLGAPDEIELLGAHRHGDAFVRRLWPGAPADMETACLGLSLSRVARLMIERGRSC